MAKLTLTDLGTTLANTAATVINTNDDRIEAAFENTLSRDGTGPNQMEADLDINNNDILNVNALEAQTLTLGGQLVVPADMVDIPAVVMLKTTYDPQNINADAFQRANHTGPVVWPVTNLTALKGLDTTKFTTAYLKQSGREGTFIWTEGDFSALVTLDTEDAIYVKADAVLASSGAWVRAYDGAVNVKWFGAVDDYSGGTQTGTDNTAAFTAALVFCEDNRQSLYVPGGLYFFNGGKLTLGGAVVMHGDGKSVTYLVFGGTPTKEAITRVIWRTEYDTGDYSSNSDAAVAWGIRVSTQDASIENLTVMTNHSGSTVYPLPFNSATDYPTSNYEYGIIVQAANVAAKSIDVFGVWATAAFVVDGSNVGGIGDGFYAEECDFFGNWGVRILGAQGQPISGDDYMDLAAGDTRTGGGVSDVLFHRCNIGDTSRGIRLNINGTLKRVRRSLTGGGLYVNGQVEGSSSKRIQGISFFECRFSASDPTVYKVNYANRVEFYSCHSEAIGGSFNTDGVTPLGASSMSIIVTDNARNVAYIGGEKSGETDSRVRRNTVDNVLVYTESNFDDPLLLGRQSSTFKLSDRGTFTPTLIATTPGTPTYSDQTGYYVRNGDLVTVWGRIVMSAITGMAGTITIEGLPFTCSNALGNSFDPPVLIITSSVGTGDAGIAGILNNNTKSISVLKIRSAATFQTLQNTDLAATSRFDFRVDYLTDEA